MRIPFRSAPLQDIRETRDADFTQLVLAQLQDRAGGNVEVGIAAAEIAAALWGRALASARVEPSTPATEALTADVLRTLGRGLIHPGESLFELMMDAGRLVLAPIGSWSIAGGPLRSTWIYETTQHGPSGSYSRTLSAERVVHCQWAYAASRPWDGTGPLELSATTVQLAKALELRMAEEAGQRVGSVLPMPAGQIDDLQASVNTLRGKALLVPTTADGWQQGQQAAPRSDWEPRRMGGNIPEAHVSLRGNVSEHVLAVCGVPVAMLGRSDGTLAREAWRQFLHGSVEPVARLVAEELAAKLDTPGLAFTFDSLRASDVQGRARAVGSLVQAGMPLAQAEIVAGIREE